VIGYESSCLLLCLIGSACYVWYTIRVSVPFHLYDHFFFIFSLKFHNLHLVAYYVLLPLQMLCQSQRQMRASVSSMTPKAASGSTHSEMMRPRFVILLATWFCLFFLWFFSVVFLDHPLIWYIWIAFFYFMS